MRHAGDPECRDTPGYAELRRLSIMVLIFYTGVFPLTFLAILLCQHRELSVNKTNQISRALLGLHREYRPSLYYFEFLQILRMQFIIGYAVFVKPGTIFQLIVAVIVSVTGLTLQTHMAPFRDPTAAYSGLVSSLAIVFVLLVCILLKSGSIAEALRDPTLGGDTLPLVDYLEFENSVINVALFTILFLILAYVLKSTLMQIYGAHLQHASIVYKGAHDVSVELRRLDTKEETLSYHTFLSHTWGSGQDVMRGLKQYLIEVLPDPKVRPPALRQTSAREKDDRFRCRAHLTQRAISLARTSPRSRAEWPPTISRLSPPCDADLP